MSLAVQMYLYSTFLIAVEKFMFIYDVSLMHVQNIAKFWQILSF